MTININFLTQKFDKSQLYQTLSMTDHLFSVLDVLLTFQNVFINFFGGGVGTYKPITTMTVTCFN